MNRMVWSGVLMLVLVGSVIVAEATLIAYDGFEGYAADDLLHGENGGNGWSGSWNVPARQDHVTVVAGGLSYNSGSIAINGGNFSLQTRYTLDQANGINGNMIFRDLPAQTAPIYLSLLYSDSENPNLGNDFTQYGFHTTADNPTMSMMRRNGEFQARLGTMTTWSTAPASPSVVGEITLLVMKVENSGLSGANTYDQISLWVNPTSLTETAPGLQQVLTSGLSSVNRFVNRTAFHELNDAYLIDELRIGSTFQSVLIPEPSAAVLMVFGGCLLVRRLGCKSAR